MKTAILALAVSLALGGVASAQQVVSGYIKKDGTYVAPYLRSTPNSTTLDNYKQPATSSYTPPKPLYSPPAYTPPKTTSLYSGGSSYTPPKPSTFSTPTATCRDGSSSYSTSRSGTCSGHGGVQSW